MLPIQGSLETCMRACMCVCVRAWMPACVRACLHACVHVCLCVCISVCVVCVHACRSVLSESLQFYMSCIVLQVDSRCGSDSCVCSAPADSSQLCLPRSPCHKRCKHTKDTHTHTHTHTHTQQQQHAYPILLYRDIVGVWH